MANPGLRDDVEVVRSAMASGGFSEEVRLGPNEARLFLALLAEHFVTGERPISVERATEIVCNISSGKSAAITGVLLHNLEHGKKVILRDTGHTRNRGIIPRYSLRIVVGMRRDCVWPIEDWEPLSVDERVNKIKEMAELIIERGISRAPRPRAPKAEALPPTEPIRFSERQARCYAALVKASRKVNFEPQTMPWITSVLEQVPNHGSIAPLIHDFELKKGLLERVGGTKGSRSNPSIVRLHLKPYTVDRENVIDPRIPGPEDEAEDDTETEPTAPSAESDLSPEPESTAPATKLDAVQVTKAELERRLKRAKDDLAATKTRMREVADIVAALNSRVNETRLEIEDLERRLVEAKERHRTAEAAFAQKPGIPSTDAEEDRVRYYKDLLRKFDEILAELSS